MGFELGKGGARYRLLYFHPDPEDGEAVCVALLIQPEPGSIEVL